MPTHIHADLAILGNPEDESDLTLLMRFDGDRDFFVCGKVTPEMVSDLRFAGALKVWPTEEEE